MKELKQKFRVYLEITDEDEYKSNNPVKQAQFDNKKKRSGPISNWIKSTQSGQQQSDGVRKWILHVWCLSPSVGLKSLIKTNVRSLILTSGTLAPLESFEAEFDTKFECKIQNPHIIKRSQMTIFPVSEAYSGVKLDSTYSNKDNINYYKALGDTIVDISNNVPDGILIFFQSYSVMNNSIRKWKDNEHNWKIWSKLNQLKPVFQEVKNKEEFTEEIVRFRESVNRGKGAAFFAICRGKLSEGIDLGDLYSRAVILVGLPYPSTQDPRVKLKKSYLDTVKHKNFTSNNWYTLQMKRALNQAIGRAIRHRDDYGCVFLLDYRFQNQTQDLSKWCRDFVRDPVTYRDMMIEVKKFYENNRSEETRRKIVVASSSKLNDNGQIDQDENKNVDLELDFSLSEYTSKSKKARRSKKRTMYESSLDDNSKKAKLPSDKVATVFDLFEPTNTIAEETEPKKERKHITIEYDTTVQQSNGQSNGQSTSQPSNHNAINILADNTNSSDSIILLDD